mmetsp:Transcript_38263/g.62209  ORF Transcript_38263/g.62209 Transcript_38263/m.62209 type:complete len:243 (-) Transcript_38263:167-895(-)
MTLTKKKKKKQQLRGLSRETELLQQQLLQNGVNWGKLYKRGRKRSRPTRWLPEDYVAERNKHSRISPENLLAGLGENRRSGATRTRLGSAAVSAAQSVVAPFSPSSSSSSPSGKQYPLTKDQAASASSRGPSSRGMRRKTRRGRQKKVTSKKRHKMKEEEEEEEEEEEGDGSDDLGEDVYEVESILDMRRMADGSREFLVSWKGYGEDENTWETGENLQCPAILNRFLSSRNEIIRSATKKT